MIKSPLRYPGGKSRVAEKIARLIPPFEEFREPFVGGGSIFIYLRQKFPHKKFWINDIYTDLAVFWQQIKANDEVVISQIQQWKNEFQNGKELHQFLRENKNAFDEIKQAAAFFVFNRITFSGTTEAGGFSQQAFEKRFTPSSIERLKVLPVLLDGVKITNLDYREIIEEKGEKVSLYLDPPYFSATNSALYGKNGKLHKVFDHREFSEKMEKCFHKWLLTYDDSEFIRRQFSFAKISDWNLTYGMRNVTEKSDQKATELFISNYLSENTKTD